MKRLLFFAALAALAWFWWSSMWARELARQAAKRHCENFGVQLIDDTVERIRIGFGRDERGQACFVRVYRFEFTPNGAFRYKGEVTTRGRTVSDIRMEPYQAG